MYYVTKECVFCVCLYPRNNSLNKSYGITCINTDINNASITMNNLSLGTAAAPVGVLVSI